MKLLIFTLAILTISCASDGKLDVASNPELQQILTEYCSEENAQSRFRLVTLIKLRAADYPEGGLCSIKGDLGLTQ